MKPKLKAVAASLLLLLALSGPAFAQGAPAPAAPAPGTPTGPAQGPAQGLSVDRGELESAKDEKIVFVNYEGPQSRIDSLASIKGIGSALGAAMPPLSSGSARSGSGRYYVIRAVDASVKEGLDADILVLGPDAEVDHVRNLRWIISGYLSAAWGYAEKDAYTIATFITVYNAVHRGDMAYIGSRYKAVVAGNVSAENAGLALRYDQWPGKSRILIPLSAGARPGSLGAVDTGAVSDKQVTESLRAEPGKGVEDRQALTDLKEREVEEKKATAEEKKGEAAKAEADLAAEKARLAEADAKLEAAKKEEAAAKAEADKAATAGDAQEAAVARSEAEKAAAEREAAAAEKAAAEKAVAAKEETAAAKTEEAAKAEAAVAAKEAEVAADRKEVSADQKAAIAEEVAAKQKGEAAGVYLFEVVDSGYPFARIVFVDADSGKLIRASALNSIRARSVVDAGDSYVAVAGREGGTGAVRLVRVEKASLMAVAEGKTDLFPESLVWKVGDSYYAVAKAEGGKWRLARFDASLAEVARCAVDVNPYTFLAEAAGGLAVQASGGGFAVLSKDKLEKVKELKP